MRLCILASVAFWLAASARAQDEAPIFTKGDRLTQQDPKDRVQRNSYSKVYSVKLEAGKHFVEQRLLARREHPVIYIGIRNFRMDVHGLQLVATHAAQVGRRRRAE